MLLWLASLRWLPSRLFRVVSGVLLLLLFILFLVFFHRCWLLFLCWRASHSCCGWRFCCCWGPAVVDIPSVPAVSIDVVVPSAVGFSTVAGVPSILAYMLLLAFLLWLTSPPFLKFPSLLVSLQFFAVMLLLAFLLLLDYCCWHSFCSWCFHGCLQRKYIDWKKTKLFGFRWNWDEEIKLRGIRLQSSSLPHLSPHLFMRDNNAPPVRRKGWSGFCRYYYCCEKCFRKGWEINDFMNTLYWNKFLYYFFLKILSLCLLFKGIVSREREYF